MIALLLRIVFHRYNHGYLLNFISVDHFFIDNRPDLDHTDSFWNIFALFKALGFPIIFMWTWSILLVSWKRKKINYIVIFELAANSDEAENVLTYINMLKVFFHS